MVNKTKELTKEIKIKKTKVVDKYIHAVGRRRSAVAKIRLYQAKTGGITVNDKPIEAYFPGEIAKKIYLEPLRTCNVIGKYLITIKVKGSGKMGQLGAVVHGLARILAKLDIEKFKPILKTRGLLTRDSRTRERRKVGMGGKARRKKQSPKR